MDPKNRYNKYDIRQFDADIGNMRGSQSRPTKGERHLPCRDDQSRKRIGEIMKRTIANNVVNELKDKIVAGIYRTGEKLPPETELCKILGVSRSSLREGLRTLEVAGYIELKPGRGSFVAESLPSTNSSAREWLSRREFDLKDLLEARRAIEPSCAQLAAAKVKDEDITYLMGLLYRFESACEQEDVEGRVTSDEALHLKIAELSHNDVLISFVTILNEKLRDYRVHLFSITGNGVHAIPLHKNIVNQITARKTQSAAQEMLAHVNDIFRNLDDLTHPK